MSLKDKMIHSGIRSCVPVLIGICLGFTLNVMIAPLLDETCDPSNISRKQLIKLRETKSLRQSEKTSESDQPTIKPKNYDIPQPLKLENDPHKKPVRPRFVATELGIREKLFVAVLTSQDTVNSFALAVNKTTAHYVTKQMYFSTSKSGNVPAGMPLVSFTDKNNKNLPLLVLKYISEHYSHAYDYYMFITDRTYIRAEKIFELVSHISISEDIFMGAADVHGDGGASMCSLEGGIIISQSVLQKILANLDWCLVSSPDSNPSRVFDHCVYHSTQLRCSQHGGDKEYRFYKVDDFDYDDDITTLREDWHFNSSFSIYPMPDDLSHFKVHRYFCQLELNLTRQEINKAKENIIHLSHYTVDGVNSLSWPIGTPEATRPKKRFDVIRWNYFTESHIYFEDDFTNLSPLTGVDKQDVQEILKTAFKRANKLYHNKFSKFQLINGYRRFEPSRGMEYKLDLKLRDKNTNSDVLKRFHLLRPLNKPELVPMPYVTETSQVFIILPLFEQDIDEGLRFLGEFQRSLIETKDNSVLCIYLLYKKEKFTSDPFVHVKAAVTSITSLPNANNKIMSKSVEMNYSTIKEIEVYDVIISDFSAGTLVTIATPYMELDQDYINRIRMNTIAGVQIFSPISYWQYKPNLAYDQKPFPDLVELNQKYGHFDSLSFVHSSFYVSDFQKARRSLTATEVKNFSLINMFLKYQKLHIFRAAEPSLKLRWQNITCGGGVSFQKDHCLERQHQHLATRAQLAKLLFEYNEENEEEGEDEEEDGEEEDVEVPFDKPFLVNRLHNEKLNN